MDIIERWLFTLYKARALAKGNFSHFLETVLIKALVDNRIKKWFYLNTVHIITIPVVVCSGLKVVDLESTVKWRVKKILSSLSVTYFAVNALQKLHLCLSYFLLISFL